MSTLVDRRDHQVPWDWQWPVATRPAWRDFTAAIIFGAFGMGVTLAVLMAGIPLFGPDIFAG